MGVHMHYSGAIVNWFFVFHNEFCLMQTEREPKGRRLFLALFRFDPALDYFLQRVERT